MEIYAYFTCFNCLVMLCLQVGEKDVGMSRKSRLEGVVKLLEIEMVDFGNFGSLRRVLSSTSLE
jgi:hypothetical protein